VISLEDSTMFLFRLGDTSVWARDWKRMEKSKQFTGRFAWKFEKLKLAHKLN